MRPLFALALLLAHPAAALAVQADWRREGVDERVKEALTARGWRLEDDGRALDPRTKAPAERTTLEKAVLDLRQDARRAALEIVNLTLASGRPLAPRDKARIAALSADLPPALAASLLDPASDLSRVKAMAEADLSLAAAYFDGGRSMADRQAAANPVAARLPGPRVELPYYSALERSVGEKMRAAAEAELARDPVGRIALSRLNRNGRPDLPPIVIEDQPGSVTAHYDFRRGAVVLDRETVLSAVVGTAPPREAAALRAALISREALLAHLDANHGAVRAVVRDHDVVIVHELTHAWQDRRDPIFREMARGNLPDIQPLEYEEEAYKTKNLYLRSKLALAPASVRMDEEFADYVEMTRSLGSWKQSLLSSIENASPARALTLRSARAVEAARLERVRQRAVTTTADQRAKALDLQALTRGGRQLRDLESAHAGRMAALDAEIRSTRTNGFKQLGSYYLVQSQRAVRRPDRIVYLGQAERWAAASRDKALIEEVRKATERKQ